uniref:Uncharacterized protein n=1 Tax=Myripristis murdjan TaxID=586833 RepID=A0A667XLX4_9TELE
MYLLYTCCCLLTMGYTQIKCIKEGAEPGDDPEDIGVLLEGVEILSGLGNIVIACALLFGLKLDGQRLSSKAQFLKNKLLYALLLTLQCYSQMLNKM